MNGSNTIISKQQKMLILWPVILFGMTWYITGHVIFENGALLWDVIWYVCRTCSVIAITTKTEPAKQRPRLNIIDSSCYVIEPAAVTTNSVNVSRSLGVSWPTLDGCIHFWPYLYSVLPRLLLQGAAPCPLFVTPCPFEKAKMTPCPFD